MTPEDVKKMGLFDKPWDGLPPSPKREAYHWLVSEDVGEVPALWIASAGMWQLWGGTTLYPPTCVAIAYRYGAEVMTMDACGEIARGILASMGV